MSLATWSALALVCLLGAMSPGPSVARIISITLRGGRTAGLVAAISHGLAVGAYALLTVTGLVLLITQSPLLFQGLQIAGALYLLRLGIGSVNSRNNQLQLEADEGTASHHSAAMEGAMIAILNPKVALFMLALFAQFLSADSSNLHKGIMVVTVITTDSLWYGFLAIMLSSSRILDWLRQYATAVERSLGVILILLAVAVLVNALLQL